MSKRNLPIKHAQAAWTIPDPGDEGTIAPTKSGVCNLVTGGAETRVLSDPFEYGQEILLAFKTDAGDCVVTAASAINVTGNTIMTFSVQGDAVLLKAVDIGGSLVWRAFGVVTGTATLESTPVLS